MGAAPLDLSQKDEDKICNLPAQERLQGFEKGRVGWPRESIME